MNRSDTWTGRVAGRRDIVLAGALGALGEVELFGHETYNAKPVWPGPTWVNAILIIALTAPFAWRRRRPLTAALLVLSVLTATTVVLGGSEAATTFIVLIAAVFSGTAHSRHIAVVVAAAVVASLAHGLNDPSSEGLADLTWTYGLVAISAVLGRAVWVRQHRIGALELDAAAERERHARDVAEATAAERSSIARELHDVVSHAVSVIVIQAQVGTRALPDDVGVAAEALNAVETSARTAMAELRHLLRLLTPDDEPAATAPLASLTQVRELVNGCRAAGLAVDLDGDLNATLPPLADLAAYRLIQEALTNTMRHAPGASACIRLRREGAMLEIIAHDDGGPEPAAGSGSQTGRGIIGMRERLALAGGRLTEAAHDGTGFRVRALIPITENPITENPITENHARPVDLAS